MNRWIIATAALGVMAVPALGQNAAAEPKPETDKIEDTRGVVQDRIAAPAPAAGVVGQAAGIGAVAQPNVVKVFRLHNAKPADVVKLIAQAFGGPAPAEGAVGAVTNLFQAIAVEGQAGGNRGQVTAAFDNRTNSLTVTGPVALLDKIGLVIRQIDGHRQEVTYLGVITSSAAPAMREQLKLGTGVGLVVDGVEAKTAAETAGMKEHDVIEKLNDQLLINTEQFTALLRSMKAGDEVTLSIIRQGERKSVQAKLGTKAIDAEAPAVNLNWTRPATPMPGAMPGNLLLMRDGDGTGPIVWSAGNADARGGGMVIAGNAILRIVDGKQTTNWSDDQLRITLERDGDATTKVTVTDAQTGKVLFTGPPPAADNPILTTVPHLDDKLKLATQAAAMQPARIVNAGVLDQMGAGRGKVAQWQDADHVLIMRVIGNKPVYLLALSKKDGRTLYDGPVMTDEQRKSIPAEVSEQFELLAAHPEQIKEFGAKAPQK